MAAVSDRQRQATPAPLSVSAALTIIASVIAHQCTTTQTSSPPSLSSAVVFKIDKSAGFLG